jgi:uncharacterized glyoxalase superfamily protein PhnB
MDELAEERMTIQSCRPLLNVTHCGASLAFYRDLLGFAVVDSYGVEGGRGWVLLRAGGVELMLNGRGDATADRKQRPGYRDVVLYFQVESVHALHRELVRLGASPTEPEAQEYGVDEMYLRDLDGYELAFTSPTDLGRRTPP